MQRMNPLSFAALSSSPKGTPLSYAGNFAATAKSRPLGEGVIAAGDDGRGVPQLRPPVKMRLERIVNRDLESRQYL